MQKSICSCATTRVQSTGLRSQQAAESRIKYAEWPQRSGLYTLNALLELAARSRLRLSIGCAGDHSSWATGAPLRTAVHTPWSTSMTAMEVLAAEPTARRWPDGDQACGGARR